MKWFTVCLFVAIAWGVSQPPHVVEPVVSCEPLAIAQNDVQVVAKFPCENDNAKRYKVMDWDTYYGYYGEMR